MTDETSNTVAGVTAQETQPTVTATVTGSSFGSIITNLVTGLEGGIFTIVLAVAAAWFPQLAQLSASDLLMIGNNFRLFLSAVSGGTPWGTALADMMDADWNAVSDSAKMVAIDFASDVATALEANDLIPQGK